AGRACGARHRRAWQAAEAAGGPLHARPAQDAQRQGDAPYHPRRLPRPGPRRRLQPGRRRDGRGHPERRLIGDGGCAVSERIHGRVSARVDTRPLRRPTLAPPAMMRFPLLLASLLGLLAFAAPAAAQQNTATLTGTVVDSTTG